MAAVCRLRVQVLTPSKPGLAVLSPGEGCAGSRDGACGELLEGHMPIGELAPVTDKARVGAAFAWLGRLLLASNHLLEPGKRAAILQRSAARGRFGTGT